MRIINDGLKANHKAAKVVTGREHNDRHNSSSAIGEKTNIGRSDLYLTLQVKEPVLGARDKEGLAHEGVVSHSYPHSLVIKKNLT